MDLRVADIDYARSRFTYRSFMRWEVGYVLILLLWFISGRPESLKQLSNAYALMFVIRIGGFLLTRWRQIEPRLHILLGLVSIFAAANLAANADPQQFGENIKIVAIFVFYLAGEATDDSFFERAPRLMLLSLFVALPVLSALTSLYQGSGAGQFDGEALSFLANRNNAVAFTVVTSWTLMLAGVPRWLIVCYLIICVLAFKTLGALVALAVAIYLACFGFNVLGTLAMAMLAAGIYFWLGDDLEILSRATASLHTLGKVLTESGGLSGLGRMNYGQIFEVAGTHDISLIFRLKHWLNLMNLYVDGPWIHELFGFGISASERLTDAKLLPHNDYLRFLFELGPGMLCCFVAANVRIFRSMFARFISIPVIFLFIYFFSDNLINNFLVMSFFYFTAGALVARERRFFSGDAADAERASWDAM